MKKVSYIYFMSNRHNNVLYVGVTNDLVRRVAEHKAKINRGFTYKYNVDKLVYFEQFRLVTDAIAREKQLKNWKREWKNELINKENPQWNDLSDSIGVVEELIEAVKAQYTISGVAGQARNDGRDISKPMGVANYLLANELPDEYKDILPSAETLKQLL